MGCERTKWSGHLAFVLAAAASAIGLGNLWRFPYLAARYGGGMFIAIYLALVATLGFTLMVTEIAIGRRTRQSQATAYARLDRRWGACGIVATVIPLVITSYYGVIGGWVVRYFVAYCGMAFSGASPMGEGAAGAQAFFSAFISAPFAPYAYALAFLLATASVVALGVKNGIERTNLVLMPALLLLAVAVSVFVVCQPGALAGLKYYLVPNADCLKGPDGSFSPLVLGRTVLGAMGQMFYSLSLAMGIMITYGSYMRDGDSIERGVRRIEICDTVVSLLAGLMIVPVVYLFAVRTGVPVDEAMNAGPGLMFVTLPKVFAMFGGAGAWVGFAFFTLVVFAALTSSISLVEACVSSVRDVLRVGRLTAVAFVAAVTMFLSVFPALGSGVWSHIRFFGSSAREGMTFIDAFDFVTNSVLMPVLAAATCLMVGWALGPKTVEDEVMRDGCPFRARRLYRFVVRYFAPVLVALILVQQVCAAFGIRGWAI